MTQSRIQAFLACAFSVMRTLKLTLAYDGTRFVGWQRQAEGESIQGLLEDALARFEGAPVTVHGAGRTDAGVHALGQVASARVTFAHDTATLARALNAQLPEDIRVIDVAEAAPDFHARFQRALQDLPIRDAHDPGFTALSIARMCGTCPSRSISMRCGRPRRCSSARTTSPRFRARAPRRAARSARSSDPELLRRTAERFEAPRGSAAADDFYEVTGDGFLRHMVRAIVGTLVEIGRGRRPAQTMADLVAGGTRADAGATAPAHGLFLVRVDYD